MEALASDSSTVYAFLFAFLRFSAETFCVLQKLWTVLPTVALSCGVLVYVLSRVPSARSVLEHMRYGCVRSTT